MEKLLTIIIICSSDVLIKDCLNSISDEQAQELIILNYPSKEVVELSQGKNIIRFDTKSLGALREFGAKNAKTPYIMFMDSDCIIEKGSISKIISELNVSDIVKPIFMYRYDSWGSKITSILRDITTNNDNLFIPIAMRANVNESIGGYYYNVNLNWGEDRDFSLRVKKSSLKISYLTNAIVYHKKMSIKNDLKSAFKLGIGRYYQVKNEVLLPRKILKDFLLIDDIKSTIKIYIRSHNLNVAIYHLFGWRFMYKVGYYYKTIKETLNDFKN